MKQFFFRKCYFVKIEVYPTGINIVSYLKLCLILCSFLIRILFTHFRKLIFAKKVNIRISIHNFLKCLAYSHLLKYFPFYYVQWGGEQKNDIDARHLEEQMVE